ncbi:MAG TPA: hypothetical protein VFO25_14075 [Candidatus Eremiobacteraceae bacterium]|nr:hypothetical protein [Candidatus Eremiobacteraceae bacterium]
MARRRRFVWAWWVGGIIAVLIIAAYVDLKYISFIVARTNNTLSPGAVGRLEPFSVACFPTSVEADTYFGARFRRDVDAQRRLLQNAIILDQGTRVTALNVGGYLEGQLLIKVIEGDHRGRDCWINTDSQFADIARPGVQGWACLDKAGVDQLLDDLRGFDATKDPRMRKRLLADAHRRIDSIEESAACPDSAVPDDFTLATAWAAADDIRLANAAHKGRADPCGMDSERVNLASTWVMVYYHWKNADREVLEATLAAFRSSAASLSLTLPALTVDDQTAWRFESDQKAREDARSMGLPC